MGKLNYYIKRIIRIKKQNESRYCCFVTLFPYTRCMSMTQKATGSASVDETQRIKSIRNNDLTVFSYIYEAYGDQIFAFIMRKCNNKFLAQDLTSDVFYKAFKNIRSCCKANNPNIRARLYVIAHNRIIDEFKRSKSSTLNPEIPIEDEQPTMSHTTTNNLLAEHILAYLKTLWDDIHELFIMRFRHQLSYQEIASINWKTVDNNKKIYSRTAKKIAEHFHWFTLNTDE